jgi:hypothetical protein
MFINLGYKYQVIFLILEFFLKSTFYLLGPTSTLLYMYFMIVYSAKSRLQNYLHFKQVG